MRQSLFGRIVLGLMVPLVGGLGAAEAKPRPPGPPPDAEFATLRGTVKEFTTAPKGEVDGLILNDGKWVHWPPHLQDRFKDLAARGDRVRVTGYWETGRRGETRFEVSTLTNQETNKSAENPDRPPPAAGAPPGAGPRRVAAPPPPPDRDRRLRDLENQVDQLRREIERLRREK
jgi:hypothetical protein